jgi:hypothetical protein
MLPYFYLDAEPLCSAFTQRQFFDAVNREGITASVETVLHLTLAQIIIIQKNRFFEKALYLCL